MSTRNLIDQLRPSSDTDLFMSRTYYIELLKYMKSSAFESIGNAYFNLDRLTSSFRLAQLGILPLERLSKGFDSDAELFMY